MEQLLWTFEDLKRFANHPDAPLRSWAVDRLIKLFPERAGEVLVTTLDDQDHFIAPRALDFLAKTGDRERYGPTLLERLSRARGEHFGRLAMTLAELGYRPALPVILSYLDQHEPGRFEFSAFLSLINALGEFGGDEARQRLWAMLAQVNDLTERVRPLMQALLQAAQPEDIPRLIEHYRTHLVDDSWHRPLLALASSVEADRLVEEIGHEVEKVLAAMVERAEWWLGEPLQLSPGCLAELGQAFDDHDAGVAEILLREAQRLVEVRGDEVAGWQATWAAGGRLVGYRRRVLYTRLILAGLTEPASIDVAQRRRETALGLGLVAQLSLEQDDQAWLETAADKTETLFTSLGQLYSLISIWLQARIEERRMRNNLQENLALMTLTARIQSRQGVALARENSVLRGALNGRQRSETKALPAPEEALLWDETIDDEPENGPDWEIS
jgi:hypothetical protein